MVCGKVTYLTDSFRDARLPRAIRASKFSKASHSGSKNNYYKTRMIKAGRNPSGVFDGCFFHIKIYH